MYGAVYNEGTGEWAFDTTGSVRSNGGIVVVFSSNLNPGDTLHAYLFAENEINTRVSDSSYDTGTVL